MKFAIELKNIRTQAADPVVFILKHAATEGLEIEGINMPVLNPHNSDTHMIFGGSSYADGVFGTITAAEAKYNNIVILKPNTAFGAMEITKRLAQMAGAKKSNAAKQEFSTFAIVNGTPVSLNEARNNSSKQEVISSEVCACGRCKNCGARVATPKKETKVGRVTCRFTESRSNGLANAVESALSVLLQ